MRSITNSRVQHFSNKMPEKHKDAEENTSQKWLQSSSLTWAFWWVLYSVEYSVTSLIGFCSIFWQGKKWNKSFYTEELKSWRKKLSFNWRLTHCKVLERYSNLVLYISNLNVACSLHVTISNSQNGNCHIYLSVYLSSIHLSIYLFIKLSVGNRRYWLLFSKLQTVGQSALVVLQTCILSNVVYSILNYIQHPLHSSLCIVT